MGPVVEPDPQHRARLEPLPFRRPLLALPLGGRRRAGVAATGQRHPQRRQRGAELLQAPTLLPQTAQLRALTDDPVQRDQRQAIKLVGQIEPAALGQRRRHRRRIEPGTTGTLRGDDGRGCHGRLAHIDLEVVVVVGGGQGVAQQRQRRCRLGIVDGAEQVRRVVVAERPYPPGPHVVLHGPWPELVTAERAPPQPARRCRLQPIQRFDTAWNRAQQPRLRVPGQLG
jgi:hypothetical protein